MRVYQFDSHRRWVAFLAILKCDQVLRKRAVFFSRLTFRKLSNAARLLTAFVFRRQLSGAIPLHLKIDVAPACQLRCPVCPHGADLSDFKSPSLMKMDLFTKLVDDGDRRIIAMSLYNLGEPLLHPSLPEMASYADKAGINTYVTTNLSLPLKDAYIQRLVESGLRSLIVAIDGVSTDTFGTQRIRGDWTQVSKNLIAIESAKIRAGRRYPEITIQFLTFDFNQHERPAAIAFAKNVGASELHFIKGETRSWLKTYSPMAQWVHKPAGRLPHCAWPYFSAVIGSRGDVVPCCTFRIADSYIGDRNTRSLGNIAASTLSEIYAAPGYMQARDMATRPGTTGSVAGHFCEGCSAIAFPAGAD